MAASRTALREAIRVLAAKGLVEARPKVGTRVTPRESWNLLDPDVMAWQHDEVLAPSFLRKLTEVRAVIEPQAAAFAAQRADADALRRWRRRSTDMAVALAGPDDAGIDAFVEADMRFHLTILRASGNDLLEQMTRVVYTALVVSFRTTSRLPEARGARCRSTAPCCARSPPASRRGHTLPCAAWSPTRRGKSASCRRERSKAHRFDPDAPSGNRARSQSGAPGPALKRTGLPEDDTR